MIPTLTIATATDADLIAKALAAYALTNIAPEDADRAEELAGAATREAAAIRRAPQDDESWLRQDYARLQ